MVHDCFNNDKQIAQNEKYWLSLSETRTVAASPEQCFVSMVLWWVTDYN